MQIDRNLHMVLPVEREGGTVYVHAAPISLAVLVAATQRCGESKPAGRGAHSNSPSASPERWRYGSTT